MGNTERDDLSRLGGQDEAWRPFVGSPDGEAWAGAAPPVHTQAPELCQGTHVLVLGTAGLSGQVSC